MFLRHRNCEERQKWGCGKHNRTGERLSPGQSDLGTGTEGEKVSHISSDKDRAVPEADATLESLFIEIKFI